jgi:hypothetical protein
MLCFAHLQFAVDRIELGHLLLVERVFILDERGGRLLGVLFGQRTLRIVPGFQYVWGHRRSEHNAVQPIFTERRDVAGHFATTHGKPDHCGVVELEGVDQGMQIFGEIVIAVSVDRLITAAKPPAVIRDYAIAGIEQSWYLGRPPLPGQRPCMDQDPGHRCGECGTIVST